MAQAIQPITTFRTGCAASRFAICLSGAMDAFDPSEPYSRIFIFNQRAPNLWTFNEHDFVIPSICTWRDPATPTLRYFVALSEEGGVVILAPTLVHEQIADAGLHHQAARGYGYLNDIQQIGGHLYACGYSGQVYRRNAADSWVHMDAGLLQDPALTEGQYFAQVINGPHEQALYVAGSENLPGHPPRCDFWDGSRWSRIDLPPTAGRITNMCVESEARIWLCGAKGTLLLGNAQQGFSTMNPLGERKLFLSVTKFQNLLYLGSNLGLFQFDPSAKRGFQKVRTGLQPELADANVAQAVEDALWSMGAKELARFDGKTWERFDHPDNPPIGGVRSKPMP